MNDINKLFCASEAVREVTGISLHELRGKARMTELTQAREIFCYLSRAVLDLQRKTVAEYLGRSMSDIRSLSKNCLRDESTDKRFARNLGLAKAKLQYYLEANADTPKRVDQPDMVNHPPHYTWLKERVGIEVIDITRHLNFNLGNAVKYILRSGRKDPDKEIEDLRKAEFYIKDEIGILERLRLREPK